MNYFRRVAIMADIRQLLSKKGWTGRELGILELTNMAIVFKQAMRGLDDKSVFNYLYRFCIIIIYKNKFPSQIAWINNQG